MKVNFQAMLQSLVLRLPGVREAAESDALRIELERTRTQLEETRAQLDETRGRPAMTEAEIAAFLKSADHAGRYRLFDACRVAAVSDFLYAERDGGRFLVNARDQYISRDLFVIGDADFSKFRVAADLVKREFGDIDVLVDVGANIGGICVPAIRGGFAKRAIAIEPQQTNCRLLRANISINGLYEKIEVFERAAGPRDGDVLSMELAVDNWGDHRVSEGSEPGIFGEAERTRVEVRSIRLDSLRASTVGERCFIWMDIQGYEGHALRGAAEWLAHRVPLVVEFWPYGMKRAESFPALRMALTGYRGFYDLERPDRIRPISELDALWNAMGLDGGFTDILVL